MEYVNPPHRLPRRRAPPQRDVAAQGRGRRRRAGRRVSKAPTLIGGGKREQLSTRATVVVFACEGPRYSRWATPGSSPLSTALERSRTKVSKFIVSIGWQNSVQEIGGESRKVTGDQQKFLLLFDRQWRASILTHLMPCSQIDISVQVLQADGGTRSACINAATLALSDAGIPMRDIVTSCSDGYLCSTPLLDLNYIEDSAGGPDVTVGILSKMDKVTLLQMDAKLPMDTFENVMGLATEGCKAIATYILEVLLENTKRVECQCG